MLSFIILIILISLTGVLMPGPLFAVTIAEGKNNKYAGILISIGQAIVEIPIIIILFLFGKIELGIIKPIIGIMGGFVLIYFAYKILKERERKEKSIISGILLTSLNPYFIIWWLTIGFSLAIKATMFGIIGLLILILFHELCDFVWYGFVSFASYHGARFEKVEKLMKAISFSLLLLFGFYFICDSILSFT